MIRYYNADALRAAPFALRDFSAAAVAGAAFLVMDPLRAMAVAFGCQLFLVYPFLFDFDFVCALVVLGLVACDDPERLQRYRMPVLAALVLALPAVLLTDPAGLSSGLAWIVCVGGAVLIAQRHRLELSREGWIRVAAAAFLLCAGLAGVARGNLVLTSGWASGVLTPKVREIWLAVKDRTPPGALIFTDQTGPAPALLGGWNTYAFIGARQIFVSNLYMNYATRLNRELTTEVLAQNEAVLQGRLPPGRLALRDRYEGYFAVVSCSRTVPSAWRRIFGNDAYCLYEIGAGQ
jgi:hypothetical protein